MATEWKWSEAHRDYYRHQWNPRSNQYDLHWGRSQVSPPTPQPAPVPQPTPGYAPPQGYDPRYAPNPYGGYPETQYAPSVSGTTAYNAPYTQYGPGHIARDSLNPSDSTSSTAGTQGSGPSTQGPGAGLQEFMSPATSPHQAHDSSDPASDDEDVPRYEYAARTSGQYTYNTSADTRYVEITNPRRYFKKGRMFQVLWSEDGAPQTPMFTKVRRFVVIRGKHNHCICLAVHTYGGLGTSKRGVVENNHAPLACEGEEHVLHHNERPLVKESLSAILEHPTTSLSPYSRIDFGRVIPIGYNFRVKTIGRISTGDLARLEEYFRAGIGVHEPDEE